jgi:hypothetical protein
LTLTVLALYMALIPYWLGGSGLLQVSATLANGTTTVVQVLGATTYNPPQDIAYTVSMQYMVDDTFGTANTVSCIPLLTAVTVYLLTSISVVLSSKSFPPHARLRVTCVAAVMAAVSAVTSYIIPVTVLRSPDFCGTPDVYYEFGFRAASSSSSTTAAAAAMHNSTRGLVVGEQEHETSTSDSDNDSSDNDNDSLGMTDFWKATDITRHDNVSSLDCALYWPGRVLLWGAFGMTLVTGLLLWNMYTMYSNSITASGGTPLLGRSRSAGAGPTVYRELSRQEEIDANHDNNGNDDEDDELDDADNREDDVEMVEYSREEGTSEIV